MRKRTKNSRAGRSHNISLEEKLRKMGLLYDATREIEELEKYGGPLLSLEEIQDVLSIIPGNLSDVIIENR